MKVVLIRHGKTAGNLEKRYVGRTDEGILEEAKEKIAYFLEAQGLKEALPEGRILGIYTSPMKRCLETAECLLPASWYPNVPRKEIPGLSECDFGRFEYKNYMELSGDGDYQRFIDSGGASGFPDGETTECFKKRTAEAFESVVEAYDGPRDGILVFVVHGGTIMAVMERFGYPKRDYYSWQTGNLKGFTADVCFETDSFRLENIAECGIL